MQLGDDLVVVHDGLLLHNFFLQGRRLSRLPVLFPPLVGRELVTLISQARQVAAIRVQTHADRDQENGHHPKGY